MSHAISRCRQLTLRQRYDIRQLCFSASWRIYLRIDTRPLQPDRLRLSAPRFRSRQGWLSPAPLATPSLFSPASWYFRHIFTMRPAAAVFRFRQLSWHYWLLIRHWHYWYQPASQHDTEPSASLFLHKMHVSGHWGIMSWENTDNMTEYNVSGITYRWVISHNTERPTGIVMGQRILSHQLHRSLHYYCIGQSHYWLTEQ